MIPIQTALLCLLLWIKFQITNQCWDGYSGSSWDSYAQTYNYAYGQPAYDYSSSPPTMYMSTYPQASSYDYYPQSSCYNHYPNDSPQPIVVVVNGCDYDEDLYDVVNLIASLNCKSENEPIYIPYPVCYDNNCDCGLDYGYSDYGCNNNGCGCSKSANCCDCDCGECRKRRTKSKCGCGCSNSDCGCNKCIKHKTNKCCRC